MSPLRIKNLNKVRFQPENEQKEGNKFYAENSGDLEKVVICSVMNSVRPEGEGSLNNT